MQSQPPRVSARAQSLAALNALFQPVPAAVAESIPDPELPTQLDAGIEADAQMHWDYVAFRWYRGVDVNGVQRVFRFQRGSSLASWHQQLRTQRLAQVFGPFKTQQAAASP